MPNAYKINFFRKLNLKKKLKLQSKPWCHIFRFWNYRRASQRLCQSIWNKENILKLKNWKILKLKKLFKDYSSPTDPTLACLAKKLILVLSAFSSDWKLTCSWLFLTCRPQMVSLLLLLLLLWWKLPSLRFLLLLLLHRRTRRNRFAFGLRNIFVHFVISVNVFTSWKIVFFLLLKL